MASIFFSYSHQDEVLRDKLEEHMSLLKRQGMVDAWHDRRITAGDEWAGKIDAELERADVILLLVSSAFIASRYCYDVEMTRALERHDAKEARVIPVILRPCDWQSSPFGRLQAVPKNATPIVSWPDHDEAFLDVVRQVRAALPQQATGARTPTPVSRSVPGPTEPRSSNLRITKAFTQADRDRFELDAFDYMRRLFETSSRELKDRNPGIDGSVRVVDADRFTAVLYKDGQAVSRCTIARGGMLRGITYSIGDGAFNNGFNESLSVDADEQELFLKPMGMGMSGNVAGKMSFQGAAEYYWAMLIAPLQRRGR